MRSKTWFDFGRCAAAAALVLAAVIPAAATQAAAPAGYRPLTPSRILDTRTGLGAPQAPVGPGGVIDVQVTGVGGVPADGVAAVVFNLTGTGSTQPTFITAYPTGGEREGSNLNLVGGTDSNLVIASVGAGGKVSLYNAFGTVDLIADVAGWFPAGDDYRPLAPSRILDTREGAGPVAGGTRHDLVVTGAGGVPTDDVAAVVLNVTGTNTTQPTFVSAYPAGGEREGSNLNLVTGQTDSSLVIATVGAGGAVSLYNGFGSVDLVVDVAGWFPMGASYWGLSPARVLDTRDGTGGVTGAVGADSHIDVQVTGVGGVPPAGVGAVVVNVTATNPTADTFVSAYPTGAERAGSNVNLRPRQTTSNLVIAAVGADGRISLYNAFGTVDLIVDVAGWFPGTPPSNHTGTLWGLGNGSLWRFDLSDPNADWVRRGQFDAAATVDLPRNQWIEAAVGPWDPLVITVRDLDTNVEVSSVEVASATWDVQDMSASPDGRYLAIVAETGSLDTWLEVIDRETNTSTDLGWDGVASEVEFTPGGELLVLLDDTYEEAFDWRAAIAVITAEQLAAGDASSIGLLHEFTNAEGVPGCLRVGPELQLTYGRNAALHVRQDAGAAHQLTTNSSGDAQSCGVFSPDGSEIAFVQRSIAAGYQRQYAIPNHRDAPIYFDWLAGDGDQYMLHERNLIASIAAWQP